MQEMFNKFFYKTFTLEQELNLLLIIHVTDYQFSRSEEIGWFNFGFLTIAESKLFDRSANIDLSYINCKFYLY
jgi:hypothetical protein